MQVGAQSLHIELRVGIVVGDERFCPLNQLPGGVQTLAAQQVMQLEAVRFEPLAELLQIGEIRDGNHAGEVFAKDLFHL